MSQEPKTMNKPTHDIGTDFIWFMGVVEDRNDPLQLGRVRVRTHYQTADKDILPTDDLPWAQITVPASAGSGDTGSSSTGYVEGSWVVGFFMDGKQKQHPLIFGAISGFPTKLPDITQGFNDPRGVYPQRIYEQDMNRLVRTRTIQKESEKLFRTEEETNAYLHPSISVRNKYVDDLTGEPVPSRSTEYPYSQVRETESGHIQEFDDTLGAERIATMHRTGTMEEYHPDGSKVNRVMKDSYHIVYGDDFVRVRGNAKVFVDGDASLYVRGKLVTQVDGDMETHVAGNYSLDVAGNIDVTTDGTHSVEAKQAMRHITNSSYTVNAQEKMSISAENDLLIQSQKSLDISTFRNFSIKSGGSLYISTDVGGDINFYAGRNIFGFYCDETDFINTCVIIPPTEVVTAVAPDAFILAPWPISATPIDSIPYSRKLDVGKGFKQIYREDMGPTPGGEVTGTIPAPLDAKTDNYKNQNPTSEAEPVTNPRLVGNSGITDSNNQPVGQQVEDSAAHSEQSGHFNVLDAALSAEALGPDAWWDGDTKKGRSTYSPPGNPRILRIFEEMGASATAKNYVKGNAYVDTCPWCAGFVGSMLRKSGNKYLKGLLAKSYWYSARSKTSKVGQLIMDYKNIDINLLKPGDILVFGRWTDGRGGSSYITSNSGHIGFWTGNKNVAGGRIGVIGGNQSNRVKVTNYPFTFVQKGKNRSGKNTEYGFIAAIRPVSGKDGKTIQPAPRGIREVVDDGDTSLRVT
tara:strand:- start:3733 stop:5967 length:2235 start_codon:yes stop_codon:yes gene_type:complete